MKEDLISFETAQDIKTMGFDTPVNYFYDKEGNLDNGDGDTEFILINHNKYNYYSAPTKSQLTEWLEKLNK